MKDGHHTWPYSGEEHPVWVKHEEEPVEDYNNRMREYITDLVKQEVIALGETKKKDSRGTVRDYKKEYAKYGSSKKAKKYRAELNKYNRQKGTYGNGDGKDASHKGGKIVGFESQSKNRGRAEKSRLKKEAMIVENPIVAATVMHMTKMHMKNPQTGRTIKATTPLRNPEHPLHGKSVSIFKKIKDKLTPDKKEEPKKQSQADADFYKKQFAGRSGKELEEDIIRKVIRQEIKSIMKEDDEAFSQPIPAQIDRYMKKFIGAMTGKNLNRKRKLAILGRVIVALRLDPSEVSKYARLVKREL